jgi:hypothetical protein
VPGVAEIARGRQREGAELRESDRESRIGPGGGRGGSHFILAQMPATAPCLQRLRKVLPRLFLPPKTRVPSAARCTQLRGCGHNPDRGDAGFEIAILASQQETTIGYELWSHLDRFLQVEVKGRASTNPWYKLDRILDGNKISPVR